MHGLVLRMLRAHDDAKRRGLTDCGDDHVGVAIEPQRKLVGELHDAARQQPAAIGAGDVRLRDRTATREDLSTIDVEPAGVLHPHAQRHFPVVVGDVVAPTGHRRRELDREERAVGHHDPAPLGGPSTAG
jgi:hypothetical protein